MDFLLQHRPEEALPLRRAPPSRAWLAACQRCRGPEILFAFFDDLSAETTPDSGALANLLRKFQSRGSQRIIRGGRVLVIQDGAELPIEPNEEVFIHLDRRRYAITQSVQIGSDAAKHFIVEQCAIIHDDSRRQSNDVLESVWLPKVTLVARVTFADCSKLTHVSMPVVESVGIGTFDCCSSLRSVSLDARDVGDFAFSQCKQLRVVALPRASVASAYIFQACTMLESVSMPVATRVCQEAFCRCDSLTAVSLPLVESVEGGAFHGCSNLETVSLPRLESVEGDAFEGCLRLSRDNFFAPDHVKNTLPASFWGLELIQ